VNVRAVKDGVLAWGTRKPGGTHPFLARILDERAHIVADDLGMHEVKTAIILGLYSARAFSSARAGCSVHQHRAVFAHGRGHGRAGSRKCRLSVDR